MIAERLLTARLEAGLTQEQAGRLADLDRNTIARYENNRGKPSLKGMMSLAVLYGRPMEWFCGDGDQVDLATLAAEVGGVEFPGSARLELRNGPVLRGGFPVVVGGYSLEFVGVARVVSVAEEGLREFDDRVVEMVPFPSGAFEEHGVEPGGCVVVEVGRGHGRLRDGTLVLVDRAEKTLVDGGVFVVVCEEGVVVRDVKVDGGRMMLEGETGLRPLGRGDVVIGRVRWEGVWLP